MNASPVYGRRVQFRVLGPLEVDAGDGPIPLGGPKQRAVLANLLIRANQLVPADTLIDEIWGDDPPERARHTLQTYVSNLRRALGGDRLQGRSPGYILLVDPFDLDAARFDSLVRDAKEALPVAPTVAVATLDDALALWRGPALADLAERSSCSRRPPGSTTSGSRPRRAASRACSPAARRPGRSASWRGCSPPTRSAKASGGS